MFFIKILNKLKERFPILAKRSAPCVKKRLKEVIAGDRFALPSSVLVKLQDSVKEVLIGEMGPCELLCAVTSKRQNGNTELIVNISMSHGAETNVA